MQDVPVGATGQAREGDRTRPARTSRGRGRRRRARIAVALVEHLPLAVFVLEADRSRRSFAIVDVNDRARKLTGLALDELVGTDPCRALGTRGDLDLSSVLANVLRTGEPASFEHVKLDTPSREGHDVDRTYSLQIFRVGRKTVALSVEDVTDEAEATAALHYRALHDALTGLPNRVLLSERLRQALREARRTNGQVALLLLDLNQFKEVNDQFGHHMGDRLLVSVADRLRETLRECDTVARLGGDEFALMLTDGSGLAGARAVADKVIACLQRPFDLDGMAIRVHASVGIAVSPQDGTDEESLHRRADAAMYKAKRAGGGVAVYERELERDSMQRLSLASDLQRAIDSGQLRLAYQPILEVVTRRVLRVEGLVRWQHPTLGLLPPREFVDLAKLSGVIRPLTAWVIDASLSQVAAWREMGIDLGVSVNLSTHNLFEAELPALIADRLRASDLPGHALTVEVNESELIDDPRAALEAVATMRTFGVRTSIDDFGIGASSLPSLPDLPVNEIKIDGSFIARLERGEATAASVVRSLTDLATSLGIDVVAEGVQSADTLALVEQLGCRFAQGYHIGPPMSAAAAGLVAAATQETRPVDLRDD